MTLPNFIIAGMQKAGTTSLHYYLSQHEDIFMAKPKELHHFDHPDVSDSLDTYRKHFSGSEGFSAQGEATPIYAFYPGAVEQINRLIPDIKIVLVLRNPIARTFSHYWHEVRHGWEHRPFLEALDRPYDDSEKYIKHYSYLERSAYSTIIDKVHNIVGDSRILVVNFEDLISDPLHITNSVVNFIAPKVNPLKSVSSEAKNIARIPRSKQIAKSISTYRENHDDNVFFRTISRFNSIEGKYPKISKQEYQQTKNLLLKLDPKIIKYYPDV